jgi:hypothetical protein
MRICATFRRKRSKMDICKLSAFTGLRPYPHYFRVVQCIQPVSRQRGWSLPTAASKTETHLVQAGATESLQF